MALRGDDDDDGGGGDEPSSKTPQRAVDSAPEAEMDASNMNQATAKAFEGMMQQKQVSLPVSRRARVRVLTTGECVQLKEFMSLYQGLVERCFSSCCNDFTSKALSSKEVRPFVLLFCDSSFAHEGACACVCAQETCVNMCTNKFLKHSERCVLIAVPLPARPPGCVCADPTGVCVNVTHRVGMRFSEQNAEMLVRFAPASSS